MPFRWTLPILLFLALVVFLNADLFRQPIFEYGDEAANSLQILRAKSFSERLGNFSRWGFHHPGPAYLYMLAAGEWFFYDLLHAVPRPINAQILAAIFLNFALILAALAIFRRHFPARSFPYLAALALAVCIHTISPTIPYGALVSVWPPPLLLWNFLLFLSAAAAVAAGRYRLLPVLAASGALLAQGHAAQAPFVLAISAVSLAIALRRLARAEGLAAAWRRHRRLVAVSAALVAAFSIPILLDACRPRPNNIDAIFSYVNASRGHFNTPAQALKFCAGFLLFTPNLETFIAQPASAQLAAAARNASVIGYGTLCAVLALAALAWRRPASRTFPVMVVIISGAAAAVFLAWAFKITGDFFTFNGLFIYSLHVLLLWVLCGLLSERIPARWQPPAAAAAAVLLLAFVWWTAPAWKNTYSGAGEMRAIVPRLSRLPAGEVRLQFEPGRWPIATGVANNLARQGGSFCVSPEWAFMFGRERVCPASHALPRLVIGPPAGACAAPCLSLLEEVGLSARWLPPDTP